jgi:N-acetylmuramoyl-L-alanine amidase
VKKHLSPFLLAAASLLLLPLPGWASDLGTWRYDTNRNVLEFATGKDVQPQAQLISDPTRLVIDLPGVVLGRPSFTESVNDGAIRSIRFGQFDRQTARIVIELAPGFTIDPNQVKFRGITARQWTVQIPEPIAANTPPASDSSGSTAATPPVDNRPTTRPTLPPLSSQVATIEGVALDASQLIIRSDRPLQYSTGWEMSTGSYRITINAAQLARSASEPRLTSTSPVRELKLRQEGDRTVVISLKPSTGVQIVGLNQVGRQQLALQLQRRTTPGSSPPPDNQIGTIPVPVPPRPTPQPPVNPPAPNSRVIVVVDPGHGGPDPGAIGIGGIREKDIVLDIGLQVASILEKSGVQAILTRSQDIDLDLEPRVQMAEQADAAVFVSIHANAIDMSRPDINGLETYYYDSGLELARVIHGNILQSMEVRDRRVRSARFYVLRRTSMPAVLVETGFVTGREDAARLANPAFRSQMAAAIARGILQYLGRTARS